MPNTTVVTANLHGMFRDVLRDAEGHVRWDSGWNKNKIVVDCRRLLAGFMRGAPTTALGIQGLKVGRGQSSWDQSGIPVVPDNQSTMVDPVAVTIERASMQFNYLELNNANVASNPTSKLQIVTTLGPGVPSWQGATHVTLREFGLFGRLDGTDVLINYVRHPAIVKDPTSTLERTIWLTF